jgi:hypothetical protein
VADVGEEETLVDGDVCSVLVGGGVSGALIGVPLPTNMGIAALLLVIFLLLLPSSLLVRDVIWFGKYPSGSGFEDGEY